MTTIYHYDEQSGEYLGESIAARDPLEGHPLIPAAATTQKPLAVGAREAAVFDRETERWRTVADYRGVTYWLEDGSSQTITRLGVLLPDNALQGAPPLTPAANRAKARAQPATIGDLDGKVAKTGDTMTGRLNFNNLDNPICLVDRNKNASADKNIGLGLISGRLERIGNLETHLYLEQYKNIDYRFCIRLTKFGSDQFWSFRSDGHLYGPHGKIVNAKDEAFSVGSYVIAVLNPSIKTRLIYNNNAILPGSHILRSNIGGDLGNDNVSTTWRAGKWGSDSLPGTWRVMTPINAHVETSNDASWCSINLFKRIF